MLIPIDDPHDPRVEPFRALRERDLATRRDGRPGAFVAEGEIVLRILLSDRSRFRPLSILIAQNRVAPLSDLLPRAARGAPIYVAAPELLTGIAGFPVHRGVLALGERTEPDLVLPPQGRSIVLVLIGLANHDNVGAAFRNAAAFGVDAVLLDRESCDPLYRKAIRVSAGAVLTVAFRRDGRADDIVARLREAGYMPIALSPSGGERIDQVVWPARTALLVGAEGPGLPPALIESLRSVRIGMVPGVDSLNVATAAGIALHAVASSGLEDWN